MGPSSHTDQPAEGPPFSYAGSLWDRPRLTGDCGGFRDQATKRGLTLDADWLQILQRVI
jgi:hypothetical protein